MNMNKKVALIFMIAVLLVPTVYFALQFWNVVAYHGYHKEVIVQVRLVDFQITANSLAIEKGYFMCNLTFSNPTSETLSLREIYVEYWESPLRWRQYLIASEYSRQIDENINPGTTRISRRLEFGSDYVGNVLLVQQPLFDVSYSLKLGPTAYAMTATIQDSTIQTDGPLYAWGVDETESTLSTYLMSVITVWAIPFEILAIAMIIQGRKAKEDGLSHHKMLSIVYGLQAFGFIAALFWGTVVNFLIPPLPASETGFKYYPVAGAIAYTIGNAFVFFISALFFLTAYGFLIKRNWTKKLALMLSLLSLFLWSYVGLNILIPLLSGSPSWLTYQRLSIKYYLSLIPLTLALAVANAIAVWVLVWQYMITRKPH